MAFICNVIWFIFGGACMAVGWLFIALLFAITIVGLPIAKACLEFAKLSAFPYGKKIVREEGKGILFGMNKVISLVLNIIWFPIGIIMSIIYLILGVLSFITIIGIPIGIVYVRMGKFVLFPIGARVVNK